MLSFNNPLVLVSAKLLGIGIDLHVEHVDDKWKLCLDVEAMFWSYCKEWGGD